MLNWLTEVSIDDSEFSFVVGTDHELCGLKVKFYIDERFGDVDVWDIPIVLNDDYELKIQDQILMPLFEEIFKIATSTES